MNWALLNRTPVVALVIAAITTLHYFSSDMDPPSRDEVRYVDYAHNLLTHQTFGLSCGDVSQPPRPGNANVPLYPMFVAGIATVDPGLSQELACVVESNGRRADCLIGTGLEADSIKVRAAGCDRGDLQGLLLAQHLLLWVSLLMVFLIAIKIFDQPKLAWLTLAIALLSGVLTKYVERVLTENLLLTLFLLLQYVLLCYWQRFSWISVSLASFAMVLLTLTRPEYLYLAVIWVIALMAIGVYLRRGMFVRHGLISLLVITLGLSPWIARNAEQLNAYGLSAGNYGEITLLYRVAYNEMGVKEWFGAFVYFLPDFGDSLAKNMLPESFYWRELDERAGSYQQVTDQKLTEMVTLERDLKSIIIEDVLSQPIKHALVTLPLTWRGVFIAKYFGLIGFFAYLLLQIREIRANRWGLAVISAPIWFIVFFHAAISINIPRYNLPLVSLYALGLAWMLNGIYRRLTAKGSSQDL